MHLGSNGLLWKLSGRQAEGTKEKDVLFAELFQFRVRTERICLSTNYQLGQSWPYVTYHQEDWKRYSSENLVLHEHIISQIMISFISMACRFDSASLTGEGRQPYQKDRDVHHTL